MFRIVRGRTLSVLLLSLGAMAMAPVSPVAAEDIQLYEGEPTDPEKVLLNYEVSAEDLTNAGLAMTAPEDETAFDSWYQAFLDLLCSLGLMPSEDSAR